MLTRPFAIEGHDQIYFAWSHLRFSDALLGPIACWSDSGRCENSDIACYAPVFAPCALDCRFPTQSTAYLPVSVEPNSLAIKAANITARSIVTTSIGIRIFPDEGEDSQTLLMNVDTATYLAKERGKNNYQFYTMEMTEKAHDNRKRLAIRIQSFPSQNGADKHTFVESCE